MANNNNFKKILVVILMIVAGLTLTACTPLTLSSPSEEAGVFKSFDYGEKWEHKNFAGLKGKKKLSLGAVETKEIILDPNDHALVYLATRNSGLFVSENAGEEWRSIYADGSVIDLALDAKSRGVVYMALGNKILKTIDQGKNWQQLYLETRPEVALTQIVLDPQENTKMIMANSQGEILISTDAGESWKLAFEAKNSVRRVLINPKNNKIIYAVTLMGAIFRSADGGKNWVNLREKYESFGGGIYRYRFLAFDPSVADGLFYVSDYGIIRTQDGGKNWQALKLLTPPEAVIINIMAINAKDAQQIYYATANTIYRTFDGGKTWLSAKAPTGKAPSYLLIDAETANVVYMGVVTVESKPFFLL
jgi:photosystem II stability/assembly factor-like uncharacterized protein